MDHHFCRGQDSHLEAVVVLVYRKGHDRKVLVGEAVVHVHIRHPIVLVVVGGSFFHNLGHSHHIVLVLVSVHADSPLESSLVAGDLDGRTGRPVQVVRSDVEEYEIDSLRLAEDVLPESVDGAV